VSTAAAIATCLAGCAAGTGPATTASTQLPRYIRPVPIGAGAQYRIRPASPAVATRRPIDGLRCQKHHAAARYGIHLELFARRLVVQVPAGIGVAPPLTRSGAYVVKGACTYPLYTLEPTGVVRIETPVPTLGTFFHVWGQPLSRDRLAGFKGPVRAFLDGRPWHGSLGAIPLRRHAEIVLEVGGVLPPHPSYRFPAGL
jgi:hypothetical protein